jgi:isovaleryl-CoA dehydrogenase
MSHLPGLDFQLGEDIDALRDAVRSFAEAEIAPRAAL